MQFNGRTVINVSLHLRFFLVQAEEQLFEFFVEGESLLTAMELRLDHPIGTDFVLEILLALFLYFQLLV